jgi:hypothetical protein
MPEKSSTRQEVHIAKPKAVESNKSKAKTFFKTFSPLLTMLVNAICRQARIALVTAARQAPTAALVSRVAARPNFVSLRALSTTLVSRYAQANMSYEQPSLSDNPPSRQLFVGNVAFDATESDIRDAVAEFGELESVRLSRFILFYPFFHC